MARPVLGMGCSRLGSLLVQGGRDAAEGAVRAALEAGITVFDTSNIYGQGSSELILGRLLPRDGVEICTKAGFVPPAPLWALRLAKGVLRPVMRPRGGLRERVAERRSRSFPQRFDAGFLLRSLDASLRRLRRPRVATFLLHNPDATAAANADLWRWVDAELSRGRIGAFGVSCAGDAQDRAWLAHAQVTVVQIPARSVLPQPAALLADPRAARLRVMVRELIGPGQHTRDAVAQRLREVATANGVSVALLGMSCREHVMQAAAMFGTMAQTAEPLAPVSVAG